MGRKLVYLLLAATMLTACNPDEDFIDDTGDGIVDNGTPKEPTDTSTTGEPTTFDLTDVLDLDLNTPDNYSNTNFPAFYTANIFNREDNTPTNNSITDRGATLGRVLFFDKQLSFNNTIACASCHNQQVGFSDADVLSKGFEGGLTGAHSMRLANARFNENGEYFWDRRAPTLEFQTTQPIQDATEMGFDASHGGIAALLTKMDGLEYYPELFDWAYGDDNITEDRMQRALAQYIRSMVSINSRFDQAFAQVGGAPNAINQDFPGFSQEENVGKQLFVGRAGCDRCHLPPTFSLIGNSRSNGLDAGETTVFRSPSLKNVAIGGPYMHDGRFSNLEQVVRHYSNGIQNGPALDNRLTQGGNQPQRLNLAQQEVDALVAFMGTLTDNTLLNDKRFTDPFRP